jgi:glycosyltransferase involved in cell wall biosynthesis
MAGKPAIAIKTGGLTRQIVNHETGEQHGAALEPEVSPLVGNQMVPYIREDYVSDATYADAIWRLHEMPADQRVSLGLRAREYALKEFSMSDMIASWDATLESTIERWKASPTPRWRSVTL